MPRLITEWSSDDPTLANMLREMAAMPEWSEERMASEAALHTFQAHWLEREIGERRGERRGRRHGKEEAMSNEPFSVPCTLGWSNHDTGPMSLRLYALDQGPQPRHEKPFARVAEQPLMEGGHATEGTRAIVVLVGDRFTPDELLAKCQAAAVNAVALTLDEAEWPPW
jgi:hypothetical protein